MTKKHKLIAAILGIFFVIYSGIWFYSAHKIKFFLNNINQVDSDTYNIKFSDISVSGYPLKIIVKAEKVEYKNNFFRNVKLNITSSQLKAQTNIFFNKFKLLIPNNIVISALVDSEEHIYKLSSKNSHEFIIKQKNFINTHKILKNYISDSENILKEIELKEIIHSAPELNIFDNHDSHVMSISDSLTSKLDSKDDKMSVSMLLNNKLNIIDKEKFNFPFSLIESSFETKVKRSLSNSNQELEIKKFNWKIDDFRAIASGDIKFLVKKLDVEVKISLENLSFLTESFAKNHYISPNQAKMIDLIFTRISGNQDLKLQEFSVYNNKENEIRIGLLSFNEIISQVQQVLMSK